MILRAYKAVELSTEKEGPDGVHYETVKKRIAEKKQVKIVFLQWVKNKIKRYLFLDYNISRKIERAFNILDRLEKWEIEIKELK